MFTYASCYHKDAHNVHNHPVNNMHILTVSSKHAKIINVANRKCIILNLGQITQPESIFDYEASESVVTFSVRNHAPPFLDEILSSLMENSTLTDVCGDNVECLFDFSQTGDATVGMAAMTFEDEAATEIQEACK